MAAKPPDPSYSCEICGAEGFTDEALRNHVVVHVSGASCPFCDLSEVTQEEMLIHVNTAHLDYLTPDSELFTFIDDDEEETTYVPPAPPSTPKMNGWSEKPALNRNINNNNNYELSKPGCSGTRGGEGSPSRSQLNLNLRNRVTTEPAPQLALQECPMCVFKASALELEEHINRIHFDLTSPSCSVPSTSATTTTLTVLKDHHCPFCVRTFQSTPDLELHVNLEHNDILSPPKPSENHTEDFGDRCPVCCRSNFVSNKEMAAHVETHFDPAGTPAPATPDVSCDRMLAKEMERRERETRRAREQREFEYLRAQYGMDNQGNFKEQSLTNMQKAVYAGEMSVADYYERQIELRKAEYKGVDDGHSCTKGLIPKIRALSNNTPSVIRNLLCTTVDHYGATYGDRGWGCGYRNVQMMISSLLHHTGYNEQLYKPAVVGGGLFGTDAGAAGVTRSAVPSISRLQQHVEWAWRQGFDMQGAEQLDGKLHNTRKWIGATEVVTALSSLRLRCQLVDFHQPTDSDGSHPEMFNWVLQYFLRVDDFKPPLYLQHQGHSRTIVGVEQYRDGQLALLVFDPSHTMEQMAQLKAPLGSSNALQGLRLIRKASAAMKARQYQIVAVMGVMETEREYEESKVLRSLRIPMDR